MKTTTNIFGFNQRNLFTKEGRFVFFANWNPEALPTATETAEKQLNNWIDRYNQIDVNVAKKKAEYEAVQEVYKKVDVLDAKIKEEEKKWEKKDTNLIAKLETEKATLLQTAKLSHGWVFECTKWTGKAMVWIPKKMAEGVFGLVSGLGEGLGWNSLLGKVQLKLTEYWQKSVTGAETLTAAGGTQTPKMTFDQMLAKIQEQTKIEVMKSILEHAEKNGIKLTFESGKFVFKKVNKVNKDKLENLTGGEKTQFDNLSKDETVIINAYAELLRENPNYDKQETITALINVLKDPNTGEIGNVSLAEVQNMLKTFNSANPKVASNIETKMPDYTKVQSLKNEIKTKKEELARVQAEMKDQKAIDARFFAASKIEIDGALQSATSQVETVLDGGVWGWAFENIFGKKESDLPQQKNAAKNFLSELVRRTNPVNDPEDKNFNASLADFQSKLKKNNKFKPQASEIVTAVQNARKTLLAAYQSTPEGRAKNDTEVQNQQKQIQKIQKAITGKEGELANEEATQASKKEGFEIALKQENLKKLSESTLGKLILAGKYPQEMWDKKLVQVQENQHQREATRTEIAENMSETMKYKPTLVENITDAIDEMPTGLKVVGGIMAVLMLKNNPKIFGEKWPSLTGLLTTLGFGGLLGHLGIKAATDGEKGIFDMMQAGIDKLKSAKDQVALIKSVEYRNVLLKLLEKDPNNSKSVTVLTVIAEDKVADLVDTNHTKKSPNGAVEITEDYYKEVLQRKFQDSKWNEVVVGDYFEKIGITQADFEKAIQTYLMQITETGTAAAGHEYITNKLDSQKTETYNPIWKGHRLLDVAFASIQPELAQAQELTEADKNAKESAENEKIKEGISSALNAIGLDALSATLKIAQDKKVSGKLGGFEVKEIVVDGTNNEIRFKIPFALGASKEVKIPQNNSQAEVQKLEKWIATEKMKDWKIQALLPASADLKFNAKTGKFHLGDNLRFDLDGEKIGNLQWKKDKNATEWKDLSTVKALQSEQSFIIDGITYKFTVDKDGIITPVGQDFSNALEGGKVEIVDEKLTRIQEILGINKEQVKALIEKGYKFELPNNQFLKITFNGNSLDIVPGTQSIKIDNFQWISPYSQKDTLLKLVDFMDKVKAGKADWWRRGMARRSTFDKSPLDDKEIQFDTDGVADPDRIRLAWESAEFVDGVQNLLNYWYFGWEQDPNKGIEFVWRYKEIQPFYNKNEVNIKNLVNRIQDYWTLPMDAENHRSAFYLENGQIKFGRDVLWNKTLNEISNNFNLTTIDFSDVPKKSDWILDTEKQNYYLMLALNKAWFDNR